MGNDNSLINFGDLSKPATVLIEKISDAIGGIALPWQIKRIAKAEAEAGEIKALADIKITEIQHRAMRRLLFEETKKQENIESITAQALNDLRDDAKPESIEEDWIFNFFEKSKLISDKEMQGLWASILAGEANKPGSYSKRTIEIVSTLNKKEAHLFTSLCTFAWHIGIVSPLIYNLEGKESLYNQKGINFDTLTHLENIGLIDFNSLGGFVRKGFSKVITIAYYGTLITVEFPRTDNNEIQLGFVLLTEAGRELALICGSSGSDEFFEFTLNKWQELGYITSCPWPSVMEYSAPASSV